MGAGSINNPRNKYHLEIIFKDKECAEFTLKLLNEYSIGAKILEKTVYLKDGEEISKMLALVGGHSTVLKFEEMRINTPGYGKKQPKNPDTVSLVR